ncbi:MAG: PKD domain-containing protein [Perlabentimonas sp.]
MKTNTFNFIKKATLLLGAFLLVTFTACKDDEPSPDPIASFQYEISEDNFLMVEFTNFSQNATSFAWDFGDGETSTEENPVHTYAEADDYTVKLTATNDEGANHVFQEEITITDPIEALRILVGETSKDWRLIREGYSMGVSETPETAFGWWSLENVGTRPCVYEQTWTFNADGTMTFDDGGAFWGDDFVFAGTDVEATCFEATAANMVNTDGDDVSAWLSGTHQFEYAPSAGTLTLTGEGAWIGLIKVTPDGDVLVPQQSVQYDVTITEETDYDLMVVSVTGTGFYWQFNYVSYHDWSNEPDVVSFMVDFAYTVEEFTATFENLSKDAVSYSWDLGDGNTSTEENPVHTYAAEGVYEVTLTGTDAGGDTKEVTKNVTISLNPTDPAPTPTEDEANVISIYSDAYTDISGVDLDPDWGQATVTQEVEIAGEMALKMADLNYQGIDFTGNPQDVSGKTTVHVDVYCAGVTDVNLSLIGGGAENPVTLTAEAGVWKSFDIDLSEYTAPDLTQIDQLKFDDAETGDSPTIFVDNIYFY